MLLPLMEHSMRKLYLYMNDMPLKRGVKLEHLLRPTIEDATPEGMVIGRVGINGGVPREGVKENKVYTSLPTPLLHALYDLFVRYEGALPPCHNTLQH